jgi:hypothetical protein
VLAALLCGVIAPQMVAVLLQAWTLTHPTWAPLAPMIVIMTQAELLASFAAFSRWILGPLAGGAGALGLWLLLRAEARGRSRRARYVQGMVGGAIVGALAVLAGLVAAVVIDLLSTGAGPSLAAQRQLVRFTLPVASVGALTGLLWGGGSRVG